MINEKLVLLFAAEIKKEQPGPLATFTMSNEREDRPKPLGSAMFPAIGSPGSWAIKGACKCGGICINPLSNSSTDVCQMPQ